MPVNRRQFLKSLGVGAASVALLPVMSLIPMPPVPPDPIFSGALGEYNGVVLHHSNRAAKVWAKSLMEEVRKESCFHKIIGKDNLIQCQ